MQNPSGWYFSLSRVLASSPYHVFGMGWFDSVNYSMSTLGTGGSATHNDSIQHFHSIGLEYSSALFCLLSGANFALLYSVAAKLDIKKLFPEFRIPNSISLSFSFHRYSLQPNSYITTVTGLKELSAADCSK